MQLISLNWVQDQTQLDGNGDPPEIERLKFDNTAKWFMHKLESIQENNMHKILWDFEVQTDHLIPARRPDVVWINKKKEFTVQ